VKSGVDDFIPPKAKFMVLINELDDIKTGEK
jgi:hypothetical protein